MTDMQKETKMKNEEIVSETKNFFDYYKKELGSSLRRGKNVIYIDFMKLTEFSSQLSEEILLNPEETIGLMEVGIEELPFIKKGRVRFYNLPKSQELKIRNIRSRHLNEMVVLEGIIRQASDVRPQVVNAKFECPSCGTIISVLQIEKKFREPTRCSCGRKGGFKLISKDMVDTQRLVIEESPESLSGGEQPKRIDTFVKEDLVEPRMEEKTTPGARVKIIGVLKEVPVPLSSGGLSTRFALAIEVNNIIPLEETFEELDISDEDERQILELSEDPDIFEKLAKSITPSVWGYEEIKKSLVLQLFGGVAKTYVDGQKNRGDMHILLIGDPGVAKSVTLNFMANISPKGRYVVGKSASGAGLTATVVRDEYLKGWSLEAGAMVLSNKGLVCIDELEKMDPQDRSAMHEAMEQQTVTISKANVQACYSEDTEILTEKGWKNYKGVGNLKIAQYNPDKKTIEFLPHKGLYEYNYKGKMYYFKNKRNDILVTPNHTMLVKKEKQNKYEKINAEDIKSYRIKFVNSGKYTNKGKNYFILPAIRHKQNRIHKKYTHQHKNKKIPMDLWLEFLGYYITEGGVETRPTIGIVQKKGVNAEKIRKCLKKLSKILGCSLSEIDCEEYVRFKITQTQLYNYLSKCGEKVFLKNLGINFSDLSKKQIGILYDSMMLGDGCSKGKYFSSISKKLIDEFQAIAHLNGKSASQNIHYKSGRGNRKECYRVTLSDRYETEMKKNSIKKVDYNGRVWCFSTSTGFFVTRRNGKIAIQGNTLRAETSVLAAANPKFGRFDPYQPIAQQIDIPPTLINRFDIIFTLRDVPDRSKDDKIASHVLSEHQKSQEDMLIDRDLFRKYVAYSKQRIRPILSDEAAREIKKFYVDLRNKPVSSDSAVRPIPISARQLQALVRMAEASAKVRLNTTVALSDAKIAIDIMKHYLMQVGYDYESKTFDIDRIQLGKSASQRNKILAVLHKIAELEGKLGKMIPIEELQQEFEDQITPEEIDEVITELKKKGDIYEPRRGFVQKV
ncbi:AAA family ATPase [Candidatus Pacearchaeota archaeon]|nr:AAA family ATPase [Candidatus Pacearchaeota archaeon]